MTAVLWLFRGDVSDLVAYTALYAAGWWTRGKLTPRHKADV